MQPTILLASGGETAASGSAIDLSSAGFQTNGNAGGVGVDDTAATIYSPVSFCAKCGRKYSQDFAGNEEINNNHLRIDRNRRAPPSLCESCADHGIKIPAYGNSFVPDVNLLIDLGSLEMVSYSQRFKARMAVIGLHCRPLFPIADKLLLKRRGNQNAAAAATAAARGVIIAAVDAESEKYLLQQQKRPNKRRLSGKQKNQPRQMQQQQLSKKLKPGVAESSGVEDQFEMQGGSQAKILSPTLTFQCHLCDKKFSRRDNLKSHMLGGHGEPQYACDRCDSAYRYPHDLKKHRFIKHGLTDELVEANPVLGPESTVMNLPIPTRIIEDVHCDNIPFVMTSDKPLPVSLTGSAHAGIVDEAYKALAAASVSTASKIAMEASTASTVASVATVANTSLKLGKTSQACKPKVQWADRHHSAKTQDGEARELTKLSVQQMQDQMSAHCPEDLDNDGFSSRSTTPEACFDFRSSDDAFRPSSRNSVDSGIGSVDEAMQWQGSETVADNVVPLPVMKQPDHSLSNLQEGFKVPQYICQYCSRVYRQRQSLKTHIDFVHFNKGYDCPECAQKFPRKTEMEDHYAMKHQENVYPCSFCSKPFKLWRQLKVHYINVHKMNSKTVDTFLTHDGKMGMGKPTILDNLGTEANSYHGIEDPWHQSRKDVAISVLESKPAPLLYEELHSNDLYSSSNKFSTPQGISSSLEPSVPFPSAASISPIVPPYPVATRHCHQSETPVPQYPIAFLNPQSSSELPLDRVPESTNH